MANRFYIVDAFADKLFGGNTAGVVILGKGKEFPEEEIMLKVAAELKYSETAFVKQIGEKEFNIRYFTPSDEVDLCGHATIGSFGALLEEGMVQEEEEYKLQTLSGELFVAIKKGFILMDMSSPKTLGEMDSDGEKEELAKVMGISKSQIVGTPELVTTGLPDIMLRVEDKDTLESIYPDFDKLSQLSKEYEAVGVHAFALANEGEKATAYCRNFAPLYDIDEEAATGTSNGALTYFLHKQNLIKEDEDNLFIQGEGMGRPSAIMSRIIKENEKLKVKVGGGYVVLARGEMEI